MSIEAYHYAREIQDMLLLMPLLPLKFSAYALRIVELFSKLESRSLSELTKLFQIAF